MDVAALNGRPQEECTRRIPDPLRQRESRSVSNSALYGLGWTGAGLKSRRRARVANVPCPPYNLYITITVPSPNPNAKSIVRAAQRRYAQAGKNAGADEDRGRDRVE